MEQGGIAESNGNICVGDRIVSVNGEMIFSVRFLCSYNLVVTISNRPLMMKP